MNIKKGAKLLAGLWLLSMASLAHSIESTPRHMVFASDPQYPWTDKTDRGEAESDAEFGKRAKWLVETQFASIAGFRNNVGGQSQVPLMINGDMTAFGHPGERSYINSSLNKHFGSEFLYGLGNHDYENNVDDCFGNRCAISSAVDYYNHHVGKVDEFDVSVKGGGFEKVYAGSLAYSKNIGEVHMVQLNNEPTYAVKISHAVNPIKFNITHALDWLETDLRLARAQGYAIIINMHKPFEMMGSAEQQNRFRAMISKYQVTAIFAGHLHQDGGDSFWVGDVPMYLSGSTSQQTYLIVSFSEDRKQLHVFLVKNNQWENRKLIDTIPVKSIWADRP